MRHRIRKWIGGAGLAFLLALSGVAPALSLCSFAEDQLVIEVIEEIPAEELEDLEDLEVPLAMAPVLKKTNSPMPVIIVAAIASVLGAYYAVQTHKRNKLFRIREEGYEEEERRLKEKQNSEE